MPTDLHHVNILVHDLDQSVSRYSGLLDGAAPIFEHLAGRGAHTARYFTNGVWIVLVKPTDSDGLLARHLAEHGEGVFLLSFRVDSLEAATRDLLARGISVSAEEPRVGLANWRVRDLASQHGSRVMLQICEERS